MGFEAVSRKQPCEICGKADWCSRSDDGKFHLCRRENNGEGIRKVDKAGCEYWIHVEEDEDASIL
mgnify:CR=1 FL=1|jgi:hypothetical protein